MCEWGNTRPVRMKLSAHVSYTGKPRWKLVQIDACIADVVEALQRGGIDMIWSCCGHGKFPGSIALADGRWLRLGMGDHEEWVEGVANAVCAQ